MEKNITLEDAVKRIKKLEKRMQSLRKNWNIIKIGK